MNSKDSFEFVLRACSLKRMNAKPSSSVGVAATVAFSQPIVRNGYLDLKQKQAAAAGVTTLTRSASASRVNPSKNREQLDV